MASDPWAEYRALHGSAFGGGAGRPTRPSFTRSTASSTFPGEASFDNENTRSAWATVGGQAASSSSGLPSQGGPPGRPEDREVFDAGCAGWPPGIQGHPQGNAWAQPPMPQTFSFQGSLGCGKGGWTSTTPNFVGPSSMYGTPSHGLGMPNGTQPTSTPMWTSSTAAAAAAASPSPPSMCGTTPPSRTPLGTMPSSFGPSLVPPVQAADQERAQSNPCVSSAATAAMNLGIPSASSRATRTVENAFEMLGLKPPVQRGQLPDQGERFIQAITGEKKSIPGWSGQPGTMRSWLKLLAYWETETTISKDRWGLRLYQSFPEGSQPRKIADQVPMSDLLSDRGYGLILSALLTKYKPYLEIAGPTSIDKFFYTGERGKSESFATYIAAKEVARQDMEMHLQETVCDRVAGRVLLRHANLTEFQREMIALKDQGTLLNFDQVSAMLRPLDRPELLAQAAGAELGSSASKHYPVMQGMEISEENPEDLDEGEDQFEDSQGSEDEDSELQEGEYVFEDREYDESEAIYIQAYHSAYADVRRDLRDRRKERGFVKRRPSGRFGKGRGRQGNPASSKVGSPPGPIQHEAPKPRRST